MGGRGGAGALGTPASRDPSDWRQISAPPLATSTSGHTIASENQMPSARKVSSALIRSRPVPRATSTAARPVGARVAGAAAVLESSAGIRSHASP